MGFPLGQAQNERPVHPGGRLEPLGRIHRAKPAGQDPQHRPPLQDGGVLFQRSLLGPRLRTDPGLPLLRFAAQHFGVLPERSPLEEVRQGRHMPERPFQGLGLLRDGHGQDLSCLGNEQGGDLRERMARVSPPAQVLNGRSLQVSGVFRALAPEDEG